MSGYYTAVAALTGLQGFWRLDESGATAADSSGNSRTGTYTGSPSQQQASIIPGEPSSGCVLFNGSSQYVTIADNANFSLPTTGALSFGFWVKPTSTAAGSHAIFSKGVAAGSQWEYVFTRDNSPSFFHVLYQADGTPRKTFDPPAVSMVDDAAYFIVVTADDSGGDAGILYINGTAGTTATGFAGSSIDGTSALNIGRRSNADQYFSGSVQGAFITNAVISGATVTALYTAGNTPPSGATSTPRTTLTTLATLETVAR